MAQFNLHERTLTSVQKEYIVNEENSLVFFHFTGFNEKDLTVISTHQDRYTFDDRPDLLQVHEEYAAWLTNHKAKFVKNPHVSIQEKLALKKRKNKDFLKAVKVIVKQILFLN